MPEAQWTMRHVCKAFTVLIVAGVMLIAVYSVLPKTGQKNKKLWRPQSPAKRANVRDRNNDLHIQPSIPHGNSKNISTLKERMRELRHQCHQLNDQGLEFQTISKSKLKHIIVNDKYRILYCYIPKVACTNLKRMFLLLGGHMNETEPLKLKASDVHLTYNKYLSYLHEYSESDIKYRVRNYQKVIFVREPLERMLSAYRNKFVQKGSVYFHNRFGRRIIKKFRKDPTEESLNNGKDVTFHEFVQYLVDPTTESQGLNEHWATYSELCHPCQIPYDFIGKYETLDEDVNSLLSLLSVDSFIKFPERGATYKAVKTEDTVESFFSEINPLFLKQLWQLYSQDYAFFGYSFPDVIKEILQKSIGIHSGAI